MHKTVLIYLVIINLAAFFLYGIDKHKARNKQWRISEKILLGIAVIGGSVGAIAGMYIFHHKTRHWYFRYGLPLIIYIQAAILISTVLWFQRTMEIKCFSRNIYDVLVEAGLDLC